MLKIFTRNKNLTSTNTLSVNQYGVQSRSFNLFSAHHFFLMISLIALFSLSACAPVPTTVIEHPTSARAEPIEPVEASSGAIYNARKHRALFQDRKPRGVGDIVTINIQENTAATKAGGSSGTRAGSVDTSVTSLFGTALPSAAIDADTAQSYADTAAANSSNVFNGTISTTVVEVLPNGYFIVSGEKQVSLDKGTEFVRFSGVVNPDNITLGNFVSSTFVADARIEYRTASKIDAAEVANTVARFFLSVGL